MGPIGFLNVCKLPGMSSHEVVARVRRILAIKRVGHAGTLDPAACGVLPICVGSATRLADYIGGWEKSYRAEFMLGVTTESGDAEKPVIARHDASAISERQVLEAMQQFVGVIHQHPPIHSAIQIGGRRAYDMARQGEEVTLPSRQVTIHAFTMLRFQPGPHPRLLADVTCSKGTYIRSLANDLGDALGVGATLSFLDRTRVGQFRLEETVTLEELAEAAESGDLSRWLLPADTPVRNLPAITLPSTAENYRVGVFVQVEEQPGLYRVYLQDAFLGLGRVLDGYLRPVVNLR